MAGLRILYVGPVPPEVGGTARGGIATHCWELALEARRNGYEVYIWGNSRVSSDVSGVHVIGTCSSYLSKALKASMALLYLHVDKQALLAFRILEPRELCQLFYRAAMLKHLVETIRPHVIHIHSLLENTIYASLFVDNLPPLVVSDHGIGVVYRSSFDEKAWRISKTRLATRISHALKLAQYIVAVSEFAKEALLADFSVSANTKVTGILNPISSEKWPLLERHILKSELGLTGKKTVVFSGVHLPFEKKGLDLLLQAVANDEWLRANCALVIITTESAGEIVRKCMRLNGIEGIVLPPQPQAQLSKYYNAGDVLVVPSRLEGIGLVYSEALISGTPVVGFYKSVQELERELGVYIGEGFNAVTEGPKELAEKIK
jgi:glycosyltransferase involved in cell wall biosynthesis